MGLEQLEPTEEEKRKMLKANEYESGLLGYKARKGETDTCAFLTIFPPHSS